MSRKPRVPSYRLHRASGQAVVTLSGHDIYLGRHGTPESHELYRRTVAEWLSNRETEALRKSGGEGDVVSVAHIMVAYLKHAREYYQKDGRPTREYELIKELCRRVKPLYACLPAVDFGPKALRAVRQTMIDDDHSRKFINKNVQRVVRMFRWAAGRELVPGHVPIDLAAVEGLKAGRSEARETKPVMPVDEVTVDATLPYLTTVVQDMVRLQCLTGMRPGEVCSLRPCDLDMLGDVWSYRPASHKTEHQGRDRAILLGPQAQAILLHYVVRESKDYCFSPAESETLRRAEVSQNRTTPLNCGHVPGSNRCDAPLRYPGEKYSADSYRRAIQRACDRSGVERWSPNQLRHSFATLVRKKFGLEAAQILLGHKHAAVTQIYAERDHDRGAAVAKEIG